MSYAGNTYTFKLGNKAPHIDDYILNGQANGVGAGGAGGRTCVGYGANPAASPNCTCIGAYAANIGCESNCTFVGSNAGNGSTYSQYAVTAIGYGAGQYQFYNSTCVGYLSGAQGWGRNSVCVGANSKSNIETVSIGASCNSATNQGDGAIAIGYNCLNGGAQAIGSIAIGRNCAAPSVSGRLAFGNSMEAIATTATAGANGAPPAQVAGYIKLDWNGVTYKVPVYNN